jgi:hypothetical protein
MRSHKVLVVATSLALIAAAMVAAPAGATSAISSTTINKPVKLSGHTTIQSAQSEIRPGPDDLSDGTTSVHPGDRANVNRPVDESPPRTKAAGPSAPGTNAAPAGGSLLASWQGLNHFDTRFGSTDGNNAFSTEPPDQGMCAGNGYVLESVNSVLVVYNSAGARVSAAMSLNDFYGYPPAFNRTTGAIGPDVFDPTCYYDPVVKRWFQVASTLESLSDGTFTGKSTIDIAVSATASPVGAWNIYRIAAQNDGTGGTPDHDCAGGPCFPDYPHIGADKYGFYVSINEFPFFADGYNGVNLYALSKSQLAAGASTVNSSLTFIDGLAENAFTVWPAQSPTIGDYATANGASEFFLSSDAVFNDATASSDHIFAWALSNTSSLNSTPSLVLTKATVPVDTYVVPDLSTQKAGAPDDAPLLTCLNDTSLVIQGLGTGCWRFFFAPQDQPAHNEVLSKLASNDSRMQQVSYANGQIWGALDTAVSVPARAGIAWYAVTPSFSHGVLSGSLAAQGLVAAAGANNLTYPAIAVRSDGKGIIGFTLVGPDYFPSAAYVTVSTAGTGSIQIASAGLGPQDGFSGYNAFGPPFDDPRWGDYGAAAVDGSSIWVASEYIATACTYTQWLNSNFRCGDTRTSIANWSTRISKVAP